MHKLFFGSLIFSLFFSACNQSAKTVKNNDPLEAGREFIDASLKGDYDYARKYILEDSMNVMYFDRYKDFNGNNNDKEKEGYKNANIIINSADNISDSVMVINYSNTFKNKPSKIKMIRKNNQWWVDFKYTFVGAQ